MIKPSFPLILLLLNFGLTQSFSQVKTAQPNKNTILTDKLSVQKGMLLISKSDCATCHKAEEKAIGPSYFDISSKYPHTSSSVNTLANKIMKGGKDNWGPVPMVPHLTITLDDAKKMAAYILLVKTELK